MIGLVQHVDIERVFVALILTLKPMFLRSFMLLGHTTMNMFGAERWYPFCINQMTIDL